MPKKRKLILVFMVLVFILVVFWVGNSLPSSNNPEEATDGQGSTSYKQIYDGNELPQEFPEDFPIYPDSEVVDAYSVTGDSSGMSVVFGTTDEIDTVSLYYKEQLIESGWELGDVSVEETVIIPFEKGDASGFLAISENTGNKGVLISVTIGGGVELPSL